MRRLLNRTDKLAMISKIVEGRLTNKDVSNLRISQELVHLTLNLGEEVGTLSPNQPTFHIDVYNDGTTKRYDQYSDGQIEYRSNKSVN